MKNYTAYELCKIIEAIDQVMGFTIRDEESYEATFDKNSETYSIQESLLDLRNEAEKMIFMINQ